MELSARGAIQHLILQVLNNGKQQIEFDLNLSDQISGKEFPIQLAKGLNHLEIRLLDDHGNVLTAPSVQFSRIRITPPGSSSAMDDILRYAGQHGR
jgi:hypothetical protein